MGPSVPSAAAGAYPPGQAGRAVDGPCLDAGGQLPLRPEDGSAEAGICSNTHKSHSERQLTDG